MKIFIDRVEGDCAVCEAEGRSFSLPRWLLPPGTDEGDILTLVLDSEAKARQKAQITELEDKLFR